MSNYDPYENYTISPPLKDPKQKKHDLDDDGYDYDWPSKPDHLDQLPDQDDDCE